MISRYRSILLSISIAAISLFCDSSALAEKNEGIADKVGQDRTTIEAVKKNEAGRSREIDTAKPEKTVAGREIRSSLRSDIKRFNTENKSGKTRKTDD